MSRDLTVDDMRTYLERKVAHANALNEMSIEIGDLLKENPDWPADKPLVECMPEGEFAAIVARHFATPDDMTAPDDPQIELEIGRLADAGYEWACEARNILVALAAIEVTLVVPS